jgi:hypothetical protein
MPLPPYQPSYYQQQPMMPPPTHPTHNMWVNGHGPAIPPPPYAVPVPYPEAAPAPAVQKRPGNPAAIVAVVCAVLGLLLSSVPLLRALFGLIALAFGILGNAESVRHDARFGKLALLGALFGVLELVALFAS